MKNIPTITRITELTKANKTSLFPLSIDCILKNTRQNIIVNANNMNATEKRSANLCIKTAFSSF